MAAAQSSGRNINWQVEGVVVVAEQRGSDHLPYRNNIRGRTTSLIKRHNDDPHTAKTTAMIAIEDWPPAKETKPAAAVAWRSGQASAMYRPGATRLSPGMMRY